MPPAFLFFLKIVLATRGRVCFHANCRIIYLNSVKNDTGILMQTILNL